MNARTTRLFSSSWLSAVISPSLACASSLASKSDDPVGTSFLLEQPFGKHAGRLPRYLFANTRKFCSPVTGLYSPSWRDLVPFSHANFFDEVWKVLSPTNLL